MKKQRTSKTDWQRVRRESREKTPIAHERGDGPYDPNDEKATEKFLAGATVRRPGQRGPQKAPTKERISLRLSRDVVEHFRATGEGWQTRIDEALQRVIHKKRA